ncbi:MAG: PQQ-like beta-propeller repeat protein [Kiritimatiellae bacterium]|nr:PQQ-like beta-propeller repeat protein [Kiritimatiellia bacterium]
MTAVWMGRKGGWLALVMAVLPGWFAFGSDWPEWQGPSRDNRSPDTGLLKSWPNEGPTLLWKTTGLGAKGFSSVAIAEGMIFTTGSPDSGECVVTAMDMNGKIKWQRPNGPEFLQSHGGSRATPTVNGGLVYVLSGMGRLGCFDAKTGQQKWTVDVVAVYGGKIPKWGYSESVLIDGDKVFVTVGGTKAGMIALDRKTGNLVWKTDPVLAASYCAPLLVEYGGVRQVVTGTGDEFVGVRVSDGKILWRFPSTNQWKVHATTPVFSEGGLFFTSGYGAGSFRLDLEINGENVSVSQKWRDPNLDNHHGGVVMVDGFVYGYGDRGGWTCLDFKTGAAKWTSKAFGKGSITYADGMLYCYSERDGTMVLARATPEKWEEVSRFKVPSGGIQEYWAHPVVFGGRLYVRHSDVLYCYDVKAK